MKDFNSAKACFYVVVLMLFVVGPCLSQGNSNLDVRVGLMTGAITHPGINVGVSRSIKTKSKEKIRRRGSFIVSKDILLLANAGVYQHLGNHTGLLYSIAIARRRKADHRRITHLYGIGIGGLTQVNAGVTYETNEQGEIEEKSLASRTYLHPHMMYELGYPFSVKVKGYTRVQLGIKTPYNTYFSIVPIIESGIRIYLKQKAE